jgi:putative restriction endonuclease
MTRSYQRSRKLISRAKEVYADANGRIRCHGCGFEGSEKYGKAGLGLIEMHHTEPLSIREGKTYEADLEQAVTKVVPLCLNCHGMVHRRPGYFMTIDYLRSLTGYGEENVG